MKGLEEDFDGNAESGSDMFFENLIEDGEVGNGVRGVDGFNINALRECGESARSEFNIGEINGVTSENVIKIEIILWLDEEEREEGFNDSGREFSDGEAVKLFNIDDDGSEKRDAANLIGASVVADVKEIGLSGLVSGENGVEGSRCFSREVIGDGNGVESVTLVEMTAVYRTASCLTVYATALYHLQTQT